MFGRFFANTGNILLIADSSLEHQRHGRTHQMFHIIKRESRRIAGQPGQLHPIADFLGILVILINQFGEAWEQAIGEMTLAFAANIGVRIQALLNPRRAPARRPNNEDDIFAQKLAQTIMGLEVVFHPRIQCCASTAQRHRIGSSRYITLSTPPRPCRVHVFKAEQALRFRCL